MSVRAKFKCRRKSHNGDPSIVDVEFEAVYGDGTDNAEWSKWTPSGVLTMQITNAPAHEQFEVGKDYFLDLSPAST